MRGENHYLLNKLSLLASAKVILFTPIRTIFFTYLQENIIVSIVSVVERLGRVRVKTTTFHLFLRFFFFFFDSFAGQ